MGQYIVARAMYIRGGEEWGDLQSLRLWAKSWSPIAI